MIYCSFEIYYPFLDPEQAQGSHVYLKHSYLRNKNVDIKISTHGAFQEKHSSVTLKIERWENQII
jgi:hypothetical protein